ncbi:hypothetical protein [Paraburkholderia xenovorans]|uniref:hypothetical protein n=1 Tax=Paraburkholderia xenovorans TaxID=36873 RepID=UPI0038BAF621
MASTNFEVPDVTLLFAEIEAGYRCPIFRDKLGRLIEPLSDFCDHYLQKLRDKGIHEKAYKTRLEHISYAMREYGIYCFSREVDWKNKQSTAPYYGSKKHYRHWLDVDDDFLVAFKDWSLLRTSKNPRYRGSKRKAMKTVNIKLRFVYQLYIWAQQAHFASNLVGWADKFLIRSILGDGNYNGHAKSPDEQKYPCCFRSIGTSSRTGDAQYWATLDDIAAIERYFHENRDPLTAERNILLLRLGQYVGWRVESANSLTVDLFSDDAIVAQEKTHRTDFLVVPPKQKNSYTFAFTVPWELAYALHAYISSFGGRGEILERLALPEHVTSGRIFISMRSGTPLSDRALSQEFGRAFRHIGAPKGAGYHSLRRFHAEDFADRTIEARKADGQSTAREEVMLEFASSLGHASLTATQAYIRASRKRSVLSVTERQQEQLVAVNLENDQLLSKLAQRQATIEERNTHMNSQRKKQCRKSRGR